MQLSVVIPMYNEADNACPLLREVHAALDGRIDYEVVVVDDGSTDDTVHRLDTLRQEIPQLRVLRHRRNLGQSTAILSGVRAAAAPWIATLDGDGQNAPADIPTLFAETRSLSDALAPVIIVGRRQKRADSWLRRVSSRVANSVRQRLLSDDCPDTGCGLKVFQRDVFLALPHFDHFHRFLPALLKRAGGSVINVPVSHRPRLHGRSKYGVHNRLWVGIVDLLGVLWLQGRPCAPEARSEWQRDEHH